MPHVTPPSQVFVTRLQPASVCWQEALRALQCLHTPADGWCMQDAHPAEALGLHGDVESSGDRLLFFQLPGSAASAAWRIVCL